MENRQRMPDMNEVDLDARTLERWDGTTNVTGNWGLASMIISK
jgi:hypothetical protein